MVVAADATETVSGAMNEGRIRVAARKPRNHREGEKDIWLEYSRREDVAGTGKDLYTQIARNGPDTHAGMAKLVDALALGASGATH